MGVSPASPGICRRHPARIRIRRSRWTRAVVESVSGMRTLRGAAVASDGPGPDLVLGCAREGAAFRQEALDLGEGTFGRLGTAVDELLRLVELDPRERGEVRVDAD